METRKRAEPACGLRRLKLLTSSPSSLAIAPTRSCAANPTAPASGPARERHAQGLIARRFISWRWRAWASRPRRSYEWFVLPGYAGGLEQLGMNAGRGCRTKGEDDGTAFGRTTRFNINFEKYGKHKGQLRCAHRSRDSRTRVRIRALTSNGSTNCADSVIVSNHYGATLTVQWRRSRC